MRKQYISEAFNDIRNIHSPRRRRLKESGNRTIRNKKSKLTEASEKINTSLALYYNVYDVLGNVYVSYFLAGKEFSKEEWQEALDRFMDVFFKEYDDYEEDEPGYFDDGEYSQLADS